MQQRAKELLALIFFTVKNLKTIPVLAEMHVFTLTLWCSTIGMNLSLHFFLFVTNNTGSPFFRKNGKMFCFEQRRLSLWSPTSMDRGVTIFIKITNFPYETNRSAADLQQICFTKNRLATDHFIVCKVCFQSVADALPSSSAKMFSCRRETDEKQICTWSVKSAESVSRLN